VTLDLNDCTFHGPALMAPFLYNGMTLDLPAGIDAVWDRLRAGLRSGGEQRVHTYVTMRLAAALGYARPLRQASVTTREGPEDGG